MGRKSTVLAACLDELPLEQRTGDRIVAMIGLCLAKCPELIEDLAPGNRLVKKRMTAAERTKVASAAAAVKLNADARIRHDRIVPIIQKVLKDNPQASLADIKTVLDNSGITPVRSAKWSRATINVIMTKAGIRAKDQS